MIICSALTMYVKKTACVLVFVLSGLCLFAQPVWNTGSGNQNTAASPAAGSTTYSVARPANIVAGDLVILVLTQQRASGTANTASFTPTAGDGFISIRNQNEANTGRTSVSAFYKIATASEPANYTGTVANNGTSPRWKAVVTRVTGHNPTTPIGPNNGTNANASAITIPAITTTSSNSLLVAVRSVRRQTGTTNAVPAGMTERWFENGTGSADANDNAPSFQGATEVLSTAGGSGTKAFSWNWASGTGNARTAGILFAINPSPVTNALPCWSRISQRFWVPSKNTTGGTIASGDVVRVSLVININQPNNTNGAGANTFPGECSGTATQELHGFSYTQTIPTGAAYQPGTLAGRTNRDLIYGGGNTDNVANLTGTFTDAQDAGDDAFFSAGAVTFNLGTGATNAAGGVVSNNSVPRQAQFIYQVTYDVLVTAPNFSTINLGGGKLRFRNTSGTNTLYEYTIPDLIVRTFPDITPAGLPVDAPNFITAASNGTFGSTTGPSSTLKYGNSPGTVGAGFSFIRRTTAGDNEYTVTAQTSADARTTPPALSVALNPSALTAAPAFNATDIVYFTSAGSPVSQSIAGGWDIISDHTNAADPGLGNPLFTASALPQGKGYMLLVNGSYAPETIFSDVSSGLTANTYYKISFWIRNICNNCHNPSGVSPTPGGDFDRSNPGVLPNVAIRINGQIVYVSGGIAYDNPTGPFNNTMSRNSWKKREFILLNSVGVSTINFEVVNFAPGGGGNDFVIDDIEIRRVLPSITYNQRCLENGFAGTLTATVNSESIPGTFDWYQWQQSDDGGDTWTNLTAPLQATAPLNPENYTVDYIVTTPAPLGRKFRLIAATTEGNLANQALIAGVAIVTVDDCCITYRTRETNTGVWTLATNWEVFDPAGTTVSFEPAPTPPVQTSRVEIRTPTTMNVDFTVEQCPLVLNDNGESVLVIDAQRTLSFGGGEDGNAYFNSRPVIVRSNSTGTGAIGIMQSDSRTFGDNNVTLERFLPGSRRRWNLLTFGVTNPDSTIWDAWAGGPLRQRVSNSTNFAAGFPLGNPPASANPGGVLKPQNRPSPWPITAPGGYVAGDGTIITGHRHRNAAAANSVGFDWWPELVIPTGSTFWRSPTESVVADAFVTTPSSIRPYRPGEISTWAPNRGTSWISSNASINTDYRGLGKSIVNATLDEAEEGYMLFTRGDRSVLENWFNSTTLTPTGQIRKFNEHSVPLSAPGLFTVIGNPYPAPIDFGELHGLNASKILKRLRIWDSNLSAVVAPDQFGFGGWRTITESSPGVWVSAPSTVGNRPQIISSSSAFLVETAASGGGTRLEFSEEIKANINNVNVLPFEVPEVGANQPSVFHADFGRFDANGTLQITDGVAILFGNYQKELTDMNDIGKLFGVVTGDERISIQRGDSLLFTFEAYPYPTEDTRFPLSSANLSRSTRYGFLLKAIDVPAQYDAFMLDHFLQTETKIPFSSEGFEYAFETTSDTASVNPNRFEIVFKSSGVLPVVITDIKATQLEKDVLVSWNVSTEESMSHYTVEHSRNGVDFAKAQTVKAVNRSPANYQWLHANPGVGFHFYRIRAMDSDGKQLLSRTVKVALGSNKTELVVFPTVVKDHQITLQMNAMKTGDYHVQVADMAGRVIEAKKLVIANGAATMLMELPHALSAGKYHVIVSGPQGKFVKPFIKQ